ncbi:molybdopterin dinucleotide binding domain-containing protein [Senegalimassilia anaerobia]|uniref:molybdopterin dinucleotide binding domain-containing protein n=1 Tax=Senegalimassilia anaerobia TaxID=1473216 RepID=UPI0026EC107B|nr:molybdopterin dinucleotide binding domain-containing protein [Senegalimassilia anaerobia]
MAKLSLTRRSFLKASAMAGAAATVGFAAAPSAALAEGADPTAGEVKRIRSCCRACGKVECGTWVTVQDNKVIKVEGDESNAHSRGHCCAKSQASMLALYHPDRLRYCLKRTKPKGEDDPGWVRISLADAFDEAGAKFNEIVSKYGGEANFAMGGTSRVWAQPPYGTLKSIFPTPNAHLAYEICKGPRHFAGILTDEIGSPWMEVEQGPLVYVQWGTAAEYSNYDSTNRTVVDCSQRAYKHILVDPRMTPLGKEADLWLPLRVGTDLCLSLTWLKWILDNEAYDDLFVRRWTNAPFLWNPEKDGRTKKGWFQEMNGGIDMESRILTEADVDREWISQWWEPAPEQYSYRRFICWDENNNKPTYWDAEACQWEGEKHKIPTTGTWIEHPYKPIIADAWLPDPSHFADPADPTYDAYWNEGNEGGKKSNPMGLPKNPALFPGGVDIKLKNGTTIKAGTVWEAFSDSLSEYTPEYCESVTEVPAEKVVEAVKIYTTRLNPLHGNGGIHYQLAPDQTGHAVQNSRALQIIACITGNSDEPAGNRGSSKAEVDGCCGRANMLVTDHEPRDWGIRDGIGTMELGNTPRDLSIEDQIPLIQNFVQYLIDEKSPLAERYGNHVPTHDEAHWIAERKGGAYKSSRSWPGLKTPFQSNEKQISAERFPLLRYWNRWADSATIWDSINGIDTPYQIHGGVCMSGDFMNESNLLEAWEALTRLDFWLDFNLWSCPNNGCADIVIPVLHWLEVNTGRVSQGAGGLFGAGQRAVEPMGDCIYDPVAVICLYKAMGVVWNNRDPEYDEWNNLDYNNFVQMGGNVTYEEQEYRVLKDATDWWKTEEFPDGPDFPQYAAKFQKEGWFDCRKWHPERWGTYRRWEMGYRRQQGGYNLYAAVDEKCAFMTPTAKVEIWSTIAETYIPDSTKTFAETCSPDRAAYDGKIPDIDKFPHWFEPKNSKVEAPRYYHKDQADQIKTSDSYINDNYMGDHLMEEYKENLQKYGDDHAFIMTTGSRQPVYFHSEHRQLPWCRELWPSPRVEINPKDAARMNIEQGDWVWIRTPWGAVREVADLYYGIKEGTINANHAWWYPEMDTASHGFELVGINCCMDKYAQCWVCGASQLRGIPALIYKATPENSPFKNPVPCDPQGNPAITNANDPRLKEWLSNDPRLADAKVELTFANMDAKGCNPSVQSPEALVTGKLPKGERGSDVLGQYSNKGQLSDKLGSYK